MARSTRWEELYRKHVDTVRARLRMRGVSASEVEDLTQNVFMVAFRRMDDVPDDLELARGWLLVTANRQAANWRRLRRHTSEVQNERAIDDALGGPDDMEAWAAVADEVRGTVNELEKKEREILVRRLVEEQTFEEIGASLGVSKSTARLWFEAARGRTRAALELLEA